MGWRRPQRALLTSAFVALLCLSGVAVRAAAPAQVNDVRLWSGPEGTRLVVDLNAASRYQVFTLSDPDRVVIDIADARISKSKTLPSGQGPVRRVRSGPRPGNDLRIVLDTIGTLEPRTFTVAPDAASGHRIVVEFPAAGSAARVAEKPNAAPLSAPAALPPAAQKPSPAVVDAAPSAPVKSVASSATGRDIVIAIDAGHGGQDPGAIGRGGTYEKHVTLAIARQLADAINREDGMKAVLIRDKDVFVPLRTRIARARQHSADLFVSVHADSVRDRSVGGSSVYVLSTRGATDEAARWLAERENAADLVGGVTLDDKNDVLASVLLDVTQKENVSDSVEAAASVLAALRRVGDVHRTKVQHAGFVVLKSPDIPSMLVETAFISNREDERKLSQPAHRAKLANAIFAGIEQYFQGNAPEGTRLSAARRGTAAGSTVELR
jgi:N-acetylmuramoyl-L-alanine amidase